MDLLLLTVLSGTGILVVMLTWTGVALVRVFAPRLHLLAIPNQRSSHCRPTPVGGGMAIVLSVGALGVLGNSLTASITPGAIALVTGGLMVALVSLLDDFNSVPFPLRLGIHGAAATLLIHYTGAWNRFDLPMIGTVGFAGLGFWITLLWVVGLTNAFNFIDGIDGMSGLQAVIIGFAWVVLGLQVHSTALSLVGLLLASSALGFLPHNWHPARIFLGDVGSTFLGFSFAGLPLLAMHSGARMPVAALLIAWPIVFDTSFTVVCRICRKQDIFLAHRTFLFLRLVDAGWSAQGVSVLYAGLTVWCAFIAITWHAGFQPGVFGAAVAALALLLVVRRAERRGETLTSLTGDFPLFRRSA